MAKRDDAKTLAEARQRWKRCDEAESAQRKAILLAKQFRAGDQWPAAIKTAREGSHAISGLPAMPPRPCLVVDRLSQPVRQISNIIKSASFGFDVQPNGAGADIDTAEIFKGYLRRVQAQSRGESPIEWAADGAIEGGIGWFRLRADYVHTTWQGDPNNPEIFDQELKLERITNNLSVYCDPSALRPTRSDAQFLFITEDLSRDEFERRWPKADVAGLEAFCSTGDMQAWVSATDDTIRIAEYWRIVYHDRTFETAPDGSITEVGKASTSPQAETLPAAVEEPTEGEPEPPPTRRVMRVPEVEGYKITASEILERWEWAGTRIPIIPILGEELNVDGKVVLRGVITEGMDAQRMVNYTYSGAMEIFALGSKSPWIAAVGQIENYKEIWQTANTYNYSYLPYDPVTIAGTVVGAPQRDTSEAPIQAAVALMRTSEEAIKATTSTGDASLGNSNPNERSGKALQALQQQSELANSNYPDNVRRALIYAGELACEVIPKITRKGQVLHILGMDDEPDQVMVGQPFQKGPDGRPVPSPEGVTPALAQMSKGLHRFYDLNQGTYTVTVTVGKAMATRREEGVAALSDLLPHLPAPMQAVLTPELIEQLHMPDAHKMAEMARKTLPPELQPQDKNAPAPVDPKIQAQMQQLQQQLQQAHQFIQTKQAEQQGTLQAAKMKADTDVHIANLNNAARIEIARIGAAKQAADTAAEAQEERLATGLELAHDVGMAAMDHQHALEQQAAQTAGQAALAQQGHQQGLESQQQQAALQPPPQAPPQGAP